MTVCVCSHCSQSNTLLFASDSMISTTDMSSDNMAFKFRGIGGHWIAMFAGNDISSITPILRDVMAYLALRPDTLDNVQAAFITSFQRLLTDKAENEVLRPLGYTMEEFKQAGLQQLGPDHFSRLLFEIQQLRIDVEFLVGGFEDEKPYIFTVSPPGKVADYSPVGFWAIGSGQTNALGSIFNAGGLSRFQDLPTNLYRICEAKFNAENAVGVGKTTFVSVLEKTGRRYSIAAPAIETLRPHWEKTRVVNVANDATNKASEILKQFGAMAQTPATATTPTTQILAPKKLKT
jgi:hypothetical protein